MGIDFSVETLPTPCYLVDEKLLRQNLEVLASVKEQTGCKILLAQKAFSMYYFYPLIAAYLDGTTASGLYEARLGKEEMGGETHIFSPAYRPDEWEEILTVADHIVFNSFSQWEKYGSSALAMGKSCGLRINPECSTGDHSLYDPCSPGSRLGITLKNFVPEKLDGISGLHFHTLCEQNSDDLLTTLEAVEAKFGAYLKGMKWLNFGGGHHITRPDYDITTLVKAINTIQQKYQLQVYLEPGEAVALHTGFLLSSVLDFVDNGICNAILDTSAACHMPDVLEMPYRPPVQEAGLPGEKEWLYRLGGPTCLAGDIIGDYSFAKPLQIGDRVVFEDMAHYTMVKNNTFNGMPLPALAVRGSDGVLKVIHSFSYSDFKERLS